LRFQPLSLYPGHILERISSSDWLVAGAVSVLFVFLRWATWSIGLPPLEWVFIGAIIAAYFAVKCFSKPQIVLGLIITGSLLGNLILFYEEGLVPFSLFQIFYILGVGLFFLRWAYLGFVSIRKTGFELELALFFSLVFLSILWTPDAERAFIHAIRVLVLSGLLFLFVNWIDKPRHITWLFISMVAAGSLLGIIALYETINNPMAILQDFLTDGHRLASRARIGQEDPNFFASLFFLPLAFTVSVSLSNISLRTRIISGLLFIILFSAVLVTFSRSAWVAVIIMLIVLGVLYRQYKLFLYSALAAVIVILVIPELRFLFVNIINRFIGLFSGGVDTSNYLRLVLLDASFRIFFDSWLVGVGWRGFPDALLTYYSLQDTMGVYEPHNVIYMVYTELGLVGLLLFVFVVLKIFRLAWANTRYNAGIEIKILSHALFGAFLAYAVFYQFLGSGFVDNQLWITTGLIISLNFYLKNQSIHHKNKV